MRIEYEYAKYITFECNDYNFFLGPDSDLRWKLFRSLKRFSTGKNLTNLEENVYGDDGLNIICDGKKLKSKDINLHIIDSRESILAACQYVKGSLMFKQVQSYENSFEINRHLEVLNNQLLLLETKIQEDFQNFSDNIIPNFSSITYSQLLKNFLGLHFVTNNEEYPIDMLAIGEVLDEYVNLLAFDLEREPKETWIVLRNLENFLFNEELASFLAKLKKIVLETGILKVFIISDSYLPFDFTSDDNEKVILLWEDFEQLPPFSVMRRSIADHYPDELIMDEEELVGRLYRIFYQIGRKTFSSYLSKKDMVLLKVISQLLKHTNVRIDDNAFDELTALEQAFLKN